MNIKNNTLSTWKTRDTLDHDAIIAICDRHKIDLNWLFGTHYSPSGFAEPPAEYGLVKNESRKRLPLIPIEAFAGFAPGVTNDLILNSEEYIVPEFSNRADFLIRINGTSMSPKYFNGDIVACKKINTTSFLQWGKVYVLDTDQGPLCKRVYPSKTERHVRLVSENKAIYPDFEIKWDDVRSLAIVIGVIRIE